MRYLFPAVYHTSCPLRIFAFPMDEQRCILQFGSWAYDGQRLIMAEKDEHPADARNYGKNSEWYLYNMTSVLNVNLYGCCPYPFYDVTFTIILRRRWEMIFLYLLVPNILINVMSIIQFLLPCDCGEKVTFGKYIIVSVNLY